MSNKIKLSITLVIVVIVAFVSVLLTFKFTKKDYNLTITDDYYINSTSYMSRESDEFVTNFSHEWNKDEADIKVHVVYDFKIIKNNSPSTVLGIWIPTDDTLFRMEFKNDHYIPIFDGIISINNQVVKEIKNDNEEEYSYSNNQLLYMYKHNKNNLFYSTETLKDEKIESIRIELNYQFTQLQGTLIGTTYKALAVNQIKGKLTNINDLSYVKKGNKIIKDTNASIFNRVKFSKVGNDYYQISKEGYDI